MLAEADLRKRARSAAYRGALHCRKISILIRNFTGLKKWKEKKKKKKKKVLCPAASCYATGALRPNCLRNFLSFFFFLGGGGGVGPSEQYFKRGPCQQLLTLLTLKSATGCKTAPRRILSFHILYTIFEAFRNWKGVFAKFTVNLWKIWGKFKNQQSRFWPLAVFLAFSTRLDI